MKNKLIAILLLLSMLCVPAMAETVTEETAAEENAWTNILLLGGDGRDVDTYDRTDCMIILSVNYEENLLKMTSIMRDTYVAFPGKTYSAKINAANVYGGPELAIETVNANFGTDIEDYVLINMAGLVEIIDLVGGVTIEVDEDERSLVNSYAADYIKNVQGYEGETTLNETGVVHLNGLLAMAYTRNRYVGSDFTRVMRQQEVLLALGNQLQEMEFDEALAITDEVLQYVVTSLEQEELKELATLCMVVELEEIAQFRLPADGAYTTTDTAADSYRIIPNLEKNQTQLHDFIYGTAEEVAE